MGRRDLMKLLKKINNKNLVKCEKNRTFANDEEPTALATDVGKPIPILSGEAASCFLQNMKKAEEEAERRRNIPPTIEQLEKQLMYEEFFLEDDLRGIEERKERISNLRNKIKFLKEKNGKTEER
jgi:hypothetical protein